MSALPAAPLPTEGRLHLIGSAIKENHATVLGGAIFNSDALTIDHSHISDNGYSGVLSTGPIYQVSGQLTITDSIITLNKATDNDSAVLCRPAANLILRDNVIYGNGRYAGWGGPPRPRLEPLWQQDLGPGRRGSCGKVEGGGAYWLHPLPQATISRGFKRGFHGGVDLVAPFGTPIRAANGGPISYAGWRGPYGIAVEIQHDYRSTLYAHLAALTVRCGRDGRARARSSASSAAAATPQDRTCILKCASGAASKIPCSLKRSAGNTGEAGPPLASEPNMRYIYPFNNRN